MWKAYPLDLVGHVELIFNLSERGEKITAILPSYLIVISG
jgi:hypothetical protein